MELDGLATAISFPYRDPNLRETNEVYEASCRIWSSLRQTSVI
ncbi:MAG: hypothetical protein ACLR8P_11905 [Clostridium fessum]